MSRKVKTGSWVQIHKIILAAGERAPHLPEDTQQVPLEMWVKGFLLQDAEIGEEVEIETYTGRRLKGELVKINPPYEHKFGRMVPELLTVGRELRQLLREEG